MPTEQTGNKTPDSVDDTNKLTLYTWNIQDGGGAKDGRFKYVQAAHKTIVEEYKPDIIVINEFENKLITDTTDYKHTTCFERTKVWAKCAIQEIKNIDKYGIVFDYGSYKIWAALVHCDIDNKSKAINDFIAPYLCNSNCIAIGDFNIDSSELLDRNTFGHYFVSKSASVNRYYRDLVFGLENGVTTGSLPAASLPQNDVSYATWSNNGDSGNYDFFISNIMDGEDENKPSPEWSVDNIRVAQNSLQPASDHNPVVVTLEIP